MENGKKAVLEEVFTYYNIAIKVGFEKDFAKELTKEYHKQLVGLINQKQHSENLSELLEKIIK